MTLRLPRLYVVCDAEVCARADWTVADFAAAALDGGATLLQIRSKQESSRTLLASADAVVARAERYGAMVIVNDRADIARLSGAAGVHVGQEDLTPTHVRAVVGAASIVGMSTHTEGQLSAAVLEAVNYIAIGPVFGTTTKDTGYKAVGVSLVQRAAAIAETQRLPVVAIGGITLDSAREVLSAGAASVAVITDLLATGDVTARVRAFLDRVSCV